MNKGSDWLFVSQMFHKVWNILYNLLWWTLKKFLKATPYKYLPKNEMKLKIVRCEQAPLVYFMALILFSLSSFLFHLLRWVWSDWQSLHIFSIFSFLLKLNINNVIIRLCRFLAPTISWKEVPFWLPHNVSTASTTNNLALGTNKLPLTSRTSTLHNSIEEKRNEHWFKYFVHDQF